MKTLLLMIVTLSTVLLFSACGNSEDTSAKEMQGQISLAGVAKADNAGENAQTMSDDQIWYDDWNEGMAAAKRDNKPAFVHFTADWCVYCKKMKSETYSVDAIKKRLGNDYVSIIIDVEAKDKSGTIYLNESEKKLLATLRGDESGFEEMTVPNKELISFFGTGLPTLVFFDTNGAPISAQAGFMPAKDFGPMLDYFRDELYLQEIKLSDYVKSKS